jgi:hypothetical protein
MTKLDEQHKANEIVRSNTIETMELRSKIRNRDALIAALGCDADKCLQDGGSEKGQKSEAIDPKKYSLLPQPIGLTLLASDAGHQIGITAVKGEHMKEREVENYQRLMAATGNYRAPLEDVRTYVKDAIKLLKEVGYVVTKSAKKK